MKSITKNSEAHGARKKIMSTKLFNNCVKALKEVGYYYIFIQEGTGCLVAAYTPPKELREIMEDEKKRDELGINECSGSCYKEFDLVIADWELESCRPTVVMQPEGRNSPGRMYYPHGSILTYAPGKSSRAIRKIGEMALNGPIG